MWRIHEKVSEVDRPIRKGRHQIDDLDAGMNKLLRTMTSITPRSIGANFSFPRSVSLIKK